jgi:pyridoxine 5-phosphate synthase
MQHRDSLRKTVDELHAEGIRVSLFVDYDCSVMEVAQEVGADRVELYTEPYAETYGTARADEVLAAFHQAAVRAQKAGLGVNAGHDLNQANLGRFLTIPDILEVSIGHALIAESLESGIEKSIGGYLEIVRAKHA